MTHAEALRLFNYVPSTGLLTWCVSKQGIRIGQAALATPDKDGYLRGSVRIDGTKQYLKQHRVIWFIMTGEWPDQVDHENGVTNDNRWINLRNASHLENNRNQKVPKHNTQGVMGVYWHKHRSRWIANIMIRGVTKHLGYFDDKTAAIAARKEAERTYGFHENHGRTMK